MDWNTFWNTVTGWLASTGIRIVISLVILLISFRLITLFGRWLTRRVQKRHVDKTIFGTLIYVGQIVLKCVVIMCLIGYLGIDTSGLTALVTSIGVCIGLAVNGALSNVAGGVLLLTTRPFRVDDHIEACGYEGVVEDIRLVNTRVRTWDNKVVYIPNGTLSTSVIVNYTEKDIRRVDLSFDFDQETDIPQLRDLLLQHISAHKYALTDPAPVVRISDQTAGKISLQVCVWTKTDYYWDVYFDLRRTTHDLFQEKGIRLSAPRLDVTVDKES